MTLVSVVIPTKDRPATVADAVRSVFAGTYQHFELFVVDQSVDDKTLLALAGFSTDSRFHYVRNLSGRPGPASSRNVGIALSAGDLVAHIDDDVTVRPEWMQRIVAEFEADPLLQFVAGKLATPPYDFASSYIPAADPAAEQPPVNNWTVSILTAGANYIMRKGLFARVGGYDEYFGPGTRLSADDGIMALQIARSGAKWKASSSIEVVHTHGVRSAAEGVNLRKAYGVGNGGIFGRVTRRGGLRAGLWYLGYLSHQFLTVVLPNIAHNRRPVGLGSLRDQLVGFGIGFRLPPEEGIVSGADLERLRKEYQTESTPGTAEAV
ncbi:MAG TPA: glycosyltransferase family A protein [Ktedonobacterales bacterium]|jgi:glycosyltransferase involved in cell wall biosynthesis|nr:glycosyltransferase family A protein [Ktedonobacterales bacterium]